MPGPTSATPCSVEKAIIAALLHDVMDTGCTFKDISAHAGKEVAEVVSAVARLSRNNQLLRRAYRRLIKEGRTVEAEAEVEAIKAMILQMTEEPLVRAIQSACAPSLSQPRICEWQARLSTIPHGVDGSRHAPAC